MNEPPLNPPDKAPLLSKEGCPRSRGRGGSHPPSPRSAKRNLPALKTFRRELRNDLTPAEAKLWTHLQHRQLEGRKFRRQHSVGPYILDFFCAAESLAIELDGESHNSEYAALRDHERDVFLRSTGILVLRFENCLVFDARDWLLGQVCGQFGWRERE